VVREEESSQGEVSEKELPDAFKKKEKTFLGTYRPFVPNRLKSLKKKKNTV